jgi:flagellar biosynthesis/type III secretory pathway protein FliH
MSSASVLPFPALQYRDAGDVALRALALVSEPSEADPEPILAGVPEEEVERRIRAARDAAIAESELRLRQRWEREREELKRQLAIALNGFAEERNSYFDRVESEVVHLALAIARKILQRETQLDPTLLAALVRIALDRMQSGPSVRLRTAPAEVEHWRRLGETAGGAARWEVVADDTLERGDCVVETELGKANFGFEAQLRDVEETFAQLLAHKPDRA